MLLATLIAAGADCSAGSVRVDRDGGREWCHLKRRLVDCRHPDQEDDATMTQHQPAPASIYCRQCGYQLVGLSESRCPECGRPFDPGNRRTFRSCPLRWYHSPVLWRLALLLMILLLIPLGQLGWLYWGWRTEQAAVAAIQKQGHVSIMMSTSDPPWLVRQLGRRFSYLLNRPQRVYLHGSPGCTMTDDTMMIVGRMRSLTTVIVRDVPISDEGLRAIQHLGELRHLGLFGTKVTDPGLEFLRRLPALEELDLSGPGITDAGLAHLAKSRQLRRLTLFRTSVTDAGLKHLLDLSQLNALALVGGRVSDAGLETLKQLRSSLILSLLETDVSPEGVQRFRLSRPDVAVDAWP